MIDNKKSKKQLIEELEYLKQQVTKLKNESIKKQYSKISEDKITEEIFFQSEIRFRDLVESLPEAVFETDRDLNLTYANKCAVQMFGYSYEDLKKDINGLEMLTPECRNQAKEAFAKRLMGEDSKSVEYQAVKKDGTTFPILFHASSIMREGEVIGVRGIIIDISELKQAENALRVSDNRFSSFMEHCPNIVFLKDVNGTYKYANPAYGNLLGIQPENIMGVNDYKLFEPEVAEILRSNDDKVRKENSTLTFEVSAEIKGEMKHYISCKFPLPDSNSEGLAVAGFAMDITDRKQAEDALRKSYELIKQERNMFISGKVVVFKWKNSEGWPVESVSPNVKEIFGYSAKEFISGAVSYATIISEEDIKTVADEVAIHSQSGTDRFNHKPYRIVRKDGKTIWIEDHTTILRDKSGNITHFFGYVLDITDRKQAEENNAQLSRAIEQSSETIVITDTKGTIQYVNPAFEKTTGYTIKEAIGQNTRVLKSCQHNDAFYKNMWNTLKSGNEWSGEIINKKKDGTLYTENATISPVFNTQGEIVNFVAAKNDITETKRLQKLESRAQRLEMAGTIAGQVAHDFNNLLAPLMAYPEIIRDELPQNHSALQYIDQIEKAAQKIADINQDLLAMGRRGHYNQVVLNLNTIIHQALEELQPYPKDLTCDLQLSDDLMDILGGGAQIHRMISNVLHNAKDAMQNNGQITIKTENYYVDDVSIAFGQVPKGEYVKLTITDTGCGIPDDIIQKIFDPFFTSKTSDKTRGSGLGMSVVDAVIKDHNGYIDLSTKLGVGTSFYIYFPITRESMGSQVIGEICGGDETILVVDDDEIQREVTLHLLSKLGYTVNTVASGEKAIEFLKKTPQDLVILDMVMPGGIDGAETFQQIQKMYSNQRAIILSGYSESNQVFKAQKLGAGAFVRKPVSKNDIATAIRTELDRKREKEIITF